MFLTDPGLVPLPNHPDLWWLDGPLVYRSVAGVIHKIPMGFVSDDASVPKALDWIPFLDRQGLSRRPGLLHDGLYALARAKGKDYCDGILQEACIAEGMTPIEASVYFKAVQWFGVSSWAEDSTEGTFGIIEGGNFISDDDFKAWVAAGATVFPGAP